MPFDSLTMSAIRSQLENNLIGGKITKVHQPDHHNVLLKVYNNGENFQLLISVHPTNGRIHFTEYPLKNPKQPLLFCMVLRKHLENSRITAIEQLGWDRVLIINFETTDETGLIINKQLVIEIMGKHSNLVLLQPENIEKAKIDDFSLKNKVIIDAIKKYSHTVSRYREVLPGKIYVAPPKQDKVDINNITFENLSKYLWQGNLNIPLYKALFKYIDGISPFLAKHIVAAAGLSEDLLVDSLGDYELNQIYTSLKDIIRCKDENDYRPVILKDKNKLIDVYPLPPSNFNPEMQEHFDNISSALDYFYHNKEQQNLFYSQQKDLNKIINQEIKKLNKKIAYQQEDYDNALDGDKFKFFAELLTTYLYKIEKGQTEIELESFYEPFDLVKISLDPSKSPMDNINKYYVKYNKAKKSRHLLKDQLEKNKSEEVYLQTVSLAISNAEKIDDLYFIKQELRGTGYLRKRKTQKGKKADLQQVYPYEFISDDNLTILVGKNNKQNDRLTFKIANKNDIWLHTKDIPGSHVIIKRHNQDEIPEATLIQAAELAAFFSRAKLSNNVPVDYTLVSEVKKPSGSKPGFVNYFQQKTLFVEPKNWLEK